MEKLRARFKLWLSTEDIEGVFGDGKWRLLEGIESEGSLAAASEKLGISYRKAWGDLKKAQECLNVTLVEKHRGGNMGGRSGLTSEGKKWVRAYGKFRREVESTVEKTYQKCFREIVK
jgi:molybdate transport system regulatory protein